MPAIAQGAAGRVVVVGGGFAGATCARFLKRINPRLTVTLVEVNRTFTACPCASRRTWRRITGGSSVRTTAGSVAK
jgi:glycine/D-amino acid oxidase-like deaminating enzyme